MNDTPAEVVHTRDWSAPWRRHAHFLPAFLLVLGTFIWMVTCGTGELFGSESFGQFYDGQAKSLLAGRWDVEPRHIGQEAFLRDGKCYGYFGFVPALLRIPAAVLMPGAEGRWSRLSQLAACAVALWYACRLLLEARRAFGLPAELDGGSRRAYAAVVLTLGLGSTLIFMASRSYVFHEAIIWGSAFALGCYCHLIRYLAGRSGGDLAAACAFSFLSFFTRGTVGAGTTAALVAAGVYVLLRSSPRVPWRHAAVLGAAVAVTAATFLAVNYAKFGTPFDPAPLHRYTLFIRNPERLERTAGKLMSVANVRSNARSYLSPSRIDLRPTFPWVFTTHSAHVYPEARLDVIEPHASLPASTPALAALVVASVVGLCRLRPDARGAFAIPAAGALAGFGATLTADAVTHRYLHDLFPFLALSAALGIHALMALAPTPRRVGTWAAVPLVLFSVWANCATSLYYQRVYVWGVPLERREQFLRWQERIDRQLGPPPVASAVPSR